MNNFSHTLRELRKNLGLTQSQMAKKMGLSLSYVHQLESEKRTPSESVKTLVQIMSVDSELAAKLADADKHDVLLQPAATLTKMVPVLGWAHAGDPFSYEEDSERNMVPTECRDPRSFAVRLEGDSMEPRFYQDNVLIVMPSEFAHSGSFAVSKFRDGGIIFRQIERQIGAHNANGTGEEFVRFIPLNTRWQITEHKEKDFEWIYPVWGCWDQLWKV